MIYPAFPSKGDTIGICAPSAGVGHKLEAFELSLEMLHSAGFRTVETDSVRSCTCPSAPPKVRAEEFTRLYSDKSISAVISASGGDYLMELLPYLDVDKLSSAPKWFAGYSDPTSLQIYLTSVLDIATIYGVNAGSWDQRPVPEYLENALNVLLGEIPVQHSFKTYQPLTEDAGEGSESPSVHPVRWRVFSDDNGRKETERFKAKGRLIGGCSDVIDTVLGTPYEDLRGFTDRYSDDGIIWFFDPFEQDPLHLRQMMVKMRFMGLFRSTVAVIFGRVFLPKGHSDEEYISELQEVMHGIPFIWGADIGHSRPSFTLINGSIVSLTIDQGAALLETECK